MYFNIRVFAIYLSCFSLDIDMNKNPEFYIDHETRLRLVEQNCVDIKVALVNLDAKLDSKLTNIDNRIHSNLVLVIGIMIASIILPVVLHALKLT
jgi:hypothetical protein